MGRPAVALRVGTFNVHGWCDATGRKRVDDVIALLRELACDVLILNEVVSPEHVLARVARTLGLVPTFADAGWGGNALLTRAAPSAVETVLLDAGGHLRSALIATVDTPVGPVDVAATHLDHTLEERRLAQLAQLLDALANRSPRVILAGDLNAMRLTDLDPAAVAGVRRHRDREGWEPARGDVVAALDRHGYVDAVRLALAGSLADYRAALASPIAKAHAVTSRVDTRIDYVWLSAPLATAVEGVRAVTRRTDVSDHHPVVVELRANMDVNES